MSEQLSEITKIVPAITTTAGASGTSAITGQAVDMTGYAGVIAMVTFGAITAGAVTSIKMQQADDQPMAGAADLAGTGRVIPDTADDTQFGIDVMRPTKRYVRLVISRGTAAATVGAANYVLYGGRNRPPVQSATIARFLSPPEGAA